VIRQPHTPKFLVTYKNAVRTSQETHYVSAVKTNRLMLFREEIAVYCENHMKHTNTLRGQNIESVSYSKWYIQQSLDFKGLIRTPVRGELHNSIRAIHQHI
jgi:hypothetical protein